MKKTHVNNDYVYSADNVKLAIQNLKHYAKIKKKYRIGHAFLFEAFDTKNYDIVIEKTSRKVGLYSSKVHIINPKLKITDDECALIASHGYLGYGYKKIGNNHYEIYTD